MLPEVIYLKNVETKKDDLARSYYAKFAQMIICMEKICAKLTSVLLRNIN
jgi:hypothetical protein